MENHEKDKARIQRIMDMESLLDKTAQLGADLAEQLDRLESAKEGMKQLFQYYGSKEWFEDRECQIPESVKAGVLLEDLVYDEFTGLRDECYRMLELATDILKNVL